jgi:hypothetical protein
MNGNKNQKKAIRKQQRKMGGSYSAARVAILGKPSLNGRIVTLVQNLLPLYDALAVEQDASRKARPLGTDLTNFLRAISTMRPAARALDNSLAAIPLADLRRIETVMYAGRELDNMATSASYGSLHRTLPRDNASVTANNLASKVPGGDYLRQGLMLAASLGINLDALP